MSDNIAHAIAGAGGGILSMIITYPLITLSTRSQVESQRAHTTVADAVRRIIQREGVSGLYAGLDSAVFGISVTNFVYYYFYEATRGTFLKAHLASKKAPSLSTLESMLAGALAGSATVLITNPIWMLNTRMTARQEASVSELPTSSKPPPRPTTFGTIRKILKEEGPSTFFAGVGPALVLVINPILQYTLFEQLKTSLTKYLARQTVTPTDAFYLGAIAKLFATGVTYPYLTVKSRMHVAGKEGRAQSMWGILTDIVKREGWAGLYRGIGPKLLQSVLTAAFLFAFKDYLYLLTVRARQRAALKRKK